MKVHIDFKIDKETLECAILDLLCLNIKISKTNIIKRIKEQVYEKGMSIIDLPDWGRSELLNDIDDYIEMYVKKYNSLIGK